MRPAAGDEADRREGMQAAVLLLAGGRGSRMGPNIQKPLLDLAGRPLIAHVLDRLTPKTSPRLLSTNSPNLYEALAARFGLTMLADRLEGFAGPLAGLDAAAACLVHTRPDITHLLVVPGDTPFLPNDLFERLSAGGSSNQARIAQVGGAMHPTVGLWPLPVLAGLPAFFASGAKRSIVGFLAGHGFEPTAIAPSNAAPGGDPFFNVNTPDDLERARLFLQHG